MQGIFHSKPQNLVSVLFNRAIGIGQEDSIVKRNEDKISKIKFMSNLSIYEKVLTRDIPGTVNFYCDGFLYTNNKSAIQRFDSPNRNFDPELILRIEEPEINILDLISYAHPIPRDICNCSNGRCNCFKKFIFILTENQWLLQVNLNTGAVMHRIYIKLPNDNIVDRFCHLEWNIYGVDFTLVSKVIETTTPLPLSYATLAVFTANPFELKYLVTFNQLAFKYRFQRIKTSQNLLFIGLNGTVKIYKLSELLKKGAAVMNIFHFPIDNPIGMYVIYDVIDPPPALFTIRMSLASLFELFPCCNTYRYFSVLIALKFLVKLCRSALACTREYSSGFTFHPDQTERFIVHSPEQLCFVQPSQRHGPRRDASAVSVLHSNDLNFGEDVLLPIFAPWPVREPAGARIVAWAYNKNLDALAVLVSHSLHDGLIKIYNNSSLQPVKEINMRQRTLPRMGYQLCFDLDLIIILEKSPPTISSRFTAFKLISTERTEDGHELISLD